MGRRDPPVGPRLYAFHGKIEDQLATRPAGAPEAAKPPEEIDVPAEVAAEISALADATRRQEETSRRLAARAVDLGLVGGADSVKFRGE